MKKYAKDYNPSLLGLHLVQLIHLLGHLVKSWYQFKKEMTPCLISPQQLSLPASSSSWPGWRRAGFCIPPSPSSASSPGPMPIKHESRCWPLQEISSLLINQSWYWTSKGGCRQEMKDLTSLSLFLFSSTWAEVAPLAWYRNTWNLGFHGVFLSTFSVYTKMKKNLLGQRRAFYN